MSDPAATLDLDQLAQALRRRAVPIITTALVAGALAAAGFAFLGKHRAEGTFTLGALEINEKKTPPLVFQRGIAPHDYKTLAPRFDAETFGAFAKRLTGAGREAAERAELELAIEERRRELLVPVYGSTRSDLRELGEASKTQENSVLGIRIGYGSRDRDRARRVVAVVGEFIGDMVFRAAVRDVVSLRSREYEAQVLLAENVLIYTRYSTAQLVGKGRTLRELRSSFPELVRGASQQVVSVADGGARYLSPSSQVVGVESTIADNREKMALAERQMRKAERQLDYYRRFAALLADVPTIDALKAALPKALGAAFPAGADPDGSIAEGRNDALLDLVAIEALRTRGLQFVVAPAIVERDPLHVARMALFAAAVTLVAGIGIVLFGVWRRSGRAG